MITLFWLSSNLRLMVNPWRQSGRSLHWCDYIVYEFAGLLLSYPCAQTQHVKIAEARYPTTPDVHILSLRLFPETQKLCMVSSGGDIQTGVLDEESGVCQVRGCRSFQTTLGTTGRLSSTRMAALKVA